MFSRSFSGKTEMHELCLVTIHILLTFLGGKTGSSADMKWMISKLRDRRSGELVTCVSNGPVEEWGGQVPTPGIASVIQILQVAPFLFAR